MLSANDLVSLSLTELNRGYTEYELVIPTLTMLWANSADAKLMVFFLFFLENRIWHFMQIVSWGDNLHEASNSVFWKNKKKYLKCHLLKFLRSMQSANGLKILDQGSYVKSHLFQVERLSHRGYHSHQNQKKKKQSEEHILLVYFSG